jgi:arginine decarboxylase
VRVHVPGHMADPSRNPLIAEWFGDRVLQLDVPPLIEGVDITPDPTPLVQAQTLAAEAWGAAQTWFLTNGASQANHLAVMVARQLGQTLVVQRSVHSSVVDALVLSGLRSAFVHPSLDEHLGIAHGVTAEDLSATLDATPDAAAVHLITPSYFGAVSDVAALAEVAHDHGVPLIVDEAWGAHFGFHPSLPPNALSQGADVVGSSTHKLGGSLTQSAMLHLGAGPFAEVLGPMVVRGLHTVQSTSTSGILLASLDLARCQLATGRKRIGESVAAADEIRARIRTHGRFRVASDDFLQFPDVVAVDPLRVAIDTAEGGISGHRAKAVLISDHRIHVEVSTGAAIVMVIGAGAAPDVDRIVTALHALPEDDGATEEGWALKVPPPGESRMTVRRAFFSAVEVVPTAEAVGRVSADTLAAYPPGIPNVLPGEVITQQLVDFFRGTTAHGGYVRGAVDRDVTGFRVVCESPPEPT